MKIYGIGTDIVNVSRLNKSIKRHGSNFKEKIFSTKEIIYCEKKKDSICNYAKRFAAKEAFSKALGTGIVNGLNFKNIEIINNKNGKPIMNLKGSALKFFKKKIKSKSFDIHLSLSDDKPWAQATVIITYK